MNQLWTEMAKDRIMAANGDKKAELVLKNASIVNVFTETVEKADIAIEKGMIVGIGTYQGEVETDLEGSCVCPGFLDGHIHLESSMVSPEEFERAVLPHGTTGVMTDPHEIANVAGITGIEYMMRSARDLALDVWFMLPSCVPATDLDESGAVLAAAELRPFFDEKKVLGLAEVMDSLGTVRCNAGILEKLGETAARGKAIDGHAPLIHGHALNAYVTAGVRSDHECSNREEALEKLARGQWIMIREGTAARNLESLMPLFEAPFYQRAMLVTDDKHPGDLLGAGHIDEIIRRAVRHGADPVRAIKMGTYNAALYFHLPGKGAVAPGYDADLVVFDNLEEMQVKQVYKGGRLVAENGLCLLSRREAPVWSDEIREGVFDSFHMQPVTLEQLHMDCCGSQQRVIDLVEKELMTKERIVEWKNHPGMAPGVDPDRDIVKLALFERHHNTGHVGLGFLGNYGLKKGAVASSIGHDSHNLIVAGVRDEDMALACNRVLENKGGLAIAVDGEILADLALPIGGLMAEMPVEEVDRKLEQMKELSRQLGIAEDIDAFMTLAFVSLPVIPEMRMTTHGVFHVGRQELVEVSFS